MRKALVTTILVLILLGIIVCWFNIKSVVNILNPISVQVNSENDNAQKKSLKEKIIESLNDDKGAAYKDVEITSIPNEKGLSVVIAEEEKDWFESLWLIHTDEEKVLWKKAIPGGPDIVEVKPIELKGFDDPIIQVYDKTHMGNGDYLLYRIHNDSPILLLDTFAVDIHHEGFPYRGKMISALIRGAKLDASYKDLNNDGFDDVILQGFIDYYEDTPGTGDYENDKLTGSGLWKKVLIYNSIENKFVQDKDLSSYTSDFEFITQYVRE